MDLFDGLYNEGIENGNLAKPLLDTAFRKQFPQLHDFIVKTSHRKHRRDHGRITIGAEVDHFKITITDPTAKSSFSIVCDKIEDGLRSMENHCAGSVIHWYYWGKEKSGRELQIPSASISTGRTKKSRTKK